MERAKMMVATAGIAVAFLVGQLTAQPPAPGKAPAKIVQTPRQQQFMSDLSASIKFNNDPKTNRMLGEASADTELADAVLEKMLNYAQRESPAERSKGETVQAIFAMHQRQRQIEVMEEIL